MHIRILSVLLAIAVLGPAPVKAQRLFRERPTLVQTRAALSIQEEALRAKRMKLLAIYGPNAPHMLALNTKIKALDKKIKQLYIDIAASGKHRVPESQRVIESSRVILLGGSV